MTSADRQQQLRAMIADLMGATFLDALSSMSEAELRCAPPFPFPRALFPDDFPFPPGLKFSDSGLSTLPPAMLHAMEHASVLGAPAEKKAKSRRWLPWRWLSRRFRRTTVLRAPPPSSPALPFASRSLHTPRYFFTVAKIFSQ